MPSHYLAISALFQCRHIGQISIFSLSSASTATGLNFAQSFYYARRIRYAATAEPKVFHILWNNKFELFDRTLLMLYYKLLGKRLVFTAHNVNARERDGRDSFLNRFSLRIQYRLSDHIFVHTEKMKDELIADFRVFKGKISVIPFGINNTVPNTRLSAPEAKRLLGIKEGDKALLFFGNIAAYKGLECLVAAFSDVLKRDGSYQYTTRNLKLFTNSAPPFPDKDLRQNDQWRFQGWERRRCGGGTTFSTKNR